MWAQHTMRPVRSITYSGCCSILLTTGPPVPLLLLLLLLLLLPDGLPAAGTSIEAAADADTHPSTHAHAQDIDPADEQVQKQRGARHADCVHDVVEVCATKRTCRCRGKQPQDKRDVLLLCYRNRHVSKRNPGIPAQSKQGAHSSVHDKGSRTSTKGNPTPPPPHPPPHPPHPATEPVTSPHDTHHFARATTSNMLG